MNQLLRPAAFVWCIAGPHIGETLPEIVSRKRRDIDKFGWTLWAYGGMGNAHPETEVRRLTGDYLEDGELLPLLMPDSGKKYPETGVPFTGYRVSRGGPVQPLPDGLSQVTGGASSWAFRITSLEWSDNAAIDVGQYVAPYSRRGRQPLPEYLKGSHGRACAARELGASTSVIRPVQILASLAAPYAVFLQR